MVGYLMFVMIGTSNQQIWIFQIILWYNLYKIAPFIIDILVQIDIVIANLKTPPQGRLSII